MAVKIRDVLNYILTHIQYFMVVIFQYFKMAGYWPSSFFPQERTWPISSHLD